MIFQEPMTSLNPCFTVGFQIMETLKVHEGGSRSERRERTIELLDQVGIPAPETRLSVLPAPALRRHEPAGDDRHGDRLQPAPADRRRADHGARRDDPGADPRPAARPAAGARHGAGADHPRHGRGRRDRPARGGAVCRPGGRGAAAARRCSRDPHHPYTAALLDALPERAWTSARLPTIPGVVPGMSDRPRGCLFNPRCRFARPSAAAKRAAAARPARGGRCAATIRCSAAQPRNHPGMAAANAVAA